ncbi:hypothetical protein F5878DRAFT_609972 [Lentinula raphanica]|uniref:Uncharacterized protein n=1 Tax=Lentinula raphanica TaxID=153919 RepID=A0AA38UH35_9AGAR|nr:hypothetical protein F5878DRAFT_609972 [Lentinula raphanica]
MCIVNGLSCLTCHLRIVSSDMACLWIGIFVFDLCILCLTLWKTYYTYKDGYMSGGLLTIVMRDGLMYFGIITLASLANIVVFLLGGEFTRGLLPVFTNIISSVMMSRLMFNLREDHIIETQMSNISFAQRRADDVLGVDSSSI